MALSNKEIPTDLREYIEINILPQYATFDKAHRLNHAEKVIEESIPSPDFGKDSGSRRKTTEMV